MNNKYIKYSVILNWIWPLTENAQPEINCHDNDAHLSGHDTSVVRISGANFVRFTVDDDNDRK